MMTAIPKISKGITLYTSGTPNGWKLGVIVKEIGLPCKVKHLDISTNIQKEEWFLKVNPNGRIPAIVDHDNDDFPVFESGAIMMYLADKAGKFYPADWNKRSEVNQWMFFMNAGVGPMQGQANHFVRFSKDKIDYPQQRYIKETYRLYSVLEERLKDHEWLAADEYTIADMATFSWVYACPLAGLDISGYPNMKKWVARILERPATLEGLNIPEGNTLLVSMKQAWNDEGSMAERVKEIQKLWVTKPEQGTA